MKITAAALENWMHSSAPKITGEFLDSICPERSKSPKIGGAAFLGFFGMINGIGNPVCYMSDHEFEIPDDAVMQYHGFWAIGLDEQRIRYLVVPSFLDGAIAPGEPIEVGKVGLLSEATQTEIEDVVRSGYKKFMELLESERKAA